MTNAVETLGGITNGVTVLFEGVAALVVTMLIFWVGFRIVRKIRG